jgi:oligopeptide transport system substrate-binding protein
LAEAGYPDGNGFPVFQYLLNSRKLSEQIAVEMQEMWRKELGIKVELRQMEWKVYLATQSKMDYDLSASSWVGDYNDPNTFLDLWMSNNGNNRTGWKNQHYDQLLTEGNSQTDLRQREQLLQQAELLLVRDEVPIVPLWFFKGITFFDDRKIDGIYVTNNMVDEHPIYAIRKKR